jgi:transcriptional regulator with PAS, ATPase and Fis domain
MNLELSLLQQINDPKLDRNARARLRCRLAKELEEAGNYEGARSALQGLWKRIGERPVLDGFDELTKALVLLRAGTLTGWIGSSRQVEGAQEEAKNLLTQSKLCFEALGNAVEALEAEIEIGWCYFREGAFDEARVTLSEAISKLPNEEKDLRAVAMVRLGDVERVTMRLNDSLRLLTAASQSVEASGNLSIKGRFHNTLAMTLRGLSAAEKRADYLDRALVEYAAASFHFEQAGHTRYRARVENNLGFLFFTIKRYEVAREHLDCARRLVDSMKDSGSCAQVDESRARLLLAQGKNLEAESMVRFAIRVQERSGEQSLLAESLITQGTALARLGQTERASMALQRAVEIASLVGDKEKAGLAALTIIEEINEGLTTSEITNTYERAAIFLKGSQHLETLMRLVACSELAIMRSHQRKAEFNAYSFLYASPQTAALLRDAHRIAEAASTVLITGETGTGKEILALLIHEWSGRDGKFVSINCGALTSTLIESQLFGHLRGSFTDAIKDHPGAVREAAGGTLFLDEIAELSAGNQSKLLRLIEQGEIHTLGASLPEHVDIRIIAATNRDLKEAVAKKRFRDDLYYRLGTFHLHLPPLRERTEDIPVLAEHFIKHVLDATGKRVTFTPESIEAIKRLPLKGNARELRALIERTAIIAAQDSLISAEAVEIVSLRQTQTANFADPWDNFSLQEEVRRFEAELIKRALDSAKGSVVEAARLLGIKHQTLSKMLQTRHKDLPPARNISSKRKRSIIRQAKL